MGIGKIGGHDHVADVEAATAQSLPAAAEQHEEAPSGAPGATATARPMSTGFHAGALQAQLASFDTGKASAAAADAPKSGQQQALDMFRNWITHKGVARHQGHADEITSTQLRSMLNEIKKDHVTQEEVDMAKKIVEEYKNTPLEDEAKELQRLVERAYKKEQKKA